ncbi:MAG: TolC family protein [Cyclobacteriaceae bacterium]
MKKKRRKPNHFISYLICLLVLGSWKVTAQSGLSELLETAEKNYPSIVAKEAMAAAADRQVALEKNTLMPSLDAAYQANYATYNNITGMLLPGQLVPISGPPSTENYNEAVPGTAASLLLKWTPLTFGQRAAAIEAEQKTYEKHLAALEDEKLRVKFKTASQYLEMVTTQSLIIAYDKNIERTTFNLDQAKALVNAGLKPAVDSMRFKSELSKSKSEKYQLEHLLQSQKEAIKELLAAEELPDLDMEASWLTTLPEFIVQGKGDTRLNPQLKMAALENESQQARLRQINREWIPQLEFWATTYARGSGIDFDGSVNPSEGWSFSRYNYGLGVQLVFPILGLSQVKIKSSRQKALLDHSKSTLNQTQLMIRRQENLAFSELSTALKIAAEVPIELEASQAAFNALQTRYNEGLIDYTDLIESQYGLFQAEARFRQSYMQSWKALLQLAVIRGDLGIFLNQIEN